MIRFFMALIVSGCLSGCAGIPSNSFIVINDACDWVSPITVSVSDTDETVRQVLALDKALTMNCPDKYH